jgi:DHA2 family multidrug resistance protein-like MFS transporter
MQTQDELAVRDGLPQPRRSWALLTLMIAVVMTVLDGSIANIALPSIAVRLHAAAADSIWVVNAYQLSVMVLLLPLAAAGEIVGYRRISQTGMAIFTVASLACAVSFTLPMLVAARVLQGIGAGCMLSVNSALVRHVFPRAQLGQAIGMAAFCVGVSASLAPSIASAILALASWPWLFAINVPLGAAAFLIAGFTLPHTPTGSHRFDWFSALLSALALGTLVVGVDALGHHGRLILVVAAFAVTLAAGTLLVRRQSSRTAPLLPVDLLRIPAFAMAIATSTGSFMAQALVFVGLPFVLEDGLRFGHVGQVATGLLMTPWPLATALTAPLAGRLADRHSAGLLAGAGMATLAAGTTGLALLPPHPPRWWIAALMAVCGLGFGFFQSPNNRAMIAASPRQRSGGASGMLGTARTLGQTLGAALVALIFGLAGSHGAGLILGMAAVVAALAAAVSFSRLRLLQ